MSSIGYVRVTTVEKALSAERLKMLNLLRKGTGSVRPCSVTNTVTMNSTSNDSNTVVIESGQTKEVPSCSVMHTVGLYKSRMGSHLGAKALIECTPPSRKDTRIQSL